jgi:hypothetical protein
MVLSAQEESLIGVVRTLPPEDAGKVLDWARQLAGLAGGRAIEWSDAWTDEDLADATAAAVQHFEPGDVAVGAFPGAHVTKTLGSHRLCVA